MIPVTFEQANTRIGPPPDLAESQCMAIPAFVGHVEGGSVDGARQIIVAWKPGAEELAALNSGAPVFLSCLGGLPPHFVTTDFETARRVA